ncbi:hypothetical protein Q5424_24720 [Conexibacter sp. JD483]|uniref:hypothetical protein n=1 Tax=unclassified Conexibacter TaxID=2627773 RepID=UPI00271DC214|nr:MULTISPECIES: hypothetical protein [unclassified Conexibacter]MDO8189319.1 hypothetical protein [Conexibacter sp. CPCC 205706]MDO8201616.1 hypothetical protein [Conexibacter sp. CPCC 205762]MDR9372326.1 hypothetical protein [Conexibacter sp. JD483]
MWRLALAMLLMAAALALAAIRSPAAEAVTFGSRLDQTPNLAFGCEARPYIALAGAQLIPTGMTSCMWWSAPLTAASTYVPVGQGVITAARVRSGPSPAPLRISVISSGGGLCCTHQRSSEVFRPAPNDVTTVPLSLTAGSGLDPNRPGSQYSDIVVVSAVGPGTLPVHDFGVHGTFNTSVPAASFLHPELTNGNSNTDVGWMDGYEVLLQVDWSATPQQAPELPTQTPVVPQTPQTPITPPAAPRLSRLARDGRALTVDVSGPARVTARVERCVVRRRPRRRTVCTTVARLGARAARAGRVRLPLPRGLHAGTYRVTISAPGAAALVRRVAVPAGGTRQK